MAVFLRKALGIGALPADMAAQVEAEGVLHRRSSLPYKTSLPEHILARISQQAFTFDVPTKFVYSICGRPVR